MAKGKTQQSQAQSQKKGGQQNPKQMKDKPSRGCCGCIFSLIRKLIVLTAVVAFLYVTTFTGYTFHVKQRMPTLDEFKAFTMESYHFGSDRAREYYVIADKHSKVYYAHFEKEYLPTIQLYTKKYTKLAVEKAGDLKELSVKYFGVAQKQVEVYYELAARKIAEFQSGKPSTPAATPKRVPETRTTPKPAQPTTPKPTEKPTPKPTAKATPVPDQKTPQASTVKTTTVPPTIPKGDSKKTGSTKKPSSTEKKEL